MRLTFVVAAFAIVSSLAAGSAVAVLGPAGDAVTAAVQSSVDAGFAYAGGLGADQGPLAQAIAQSAIESARGQAEAAVGVTGGIGATTLAAGTAVLGDSPAGSPDDLGVACAFAPGAGVALDCALAHLQALAA